jgi:hypothetical protein
MCSSSTRALSPAVHGLRPSKAMRDREGTEAAQFNLVAARRRRSNLVKNGHSDALNVARIEMGIAFD